MTETESDDRSSLERAGTLLDLGRHSDARSILSQFVATNPDSSQGWLLMARAQAGMNDLSPALGSAQRAIAVDPENASAHQLASFIYSRQDCHVEALREAQEAARLAPSSWTTMSRLAMAHAMTPWTYDWTEARAAANRARELAPLEARAHVTVGSVELAAHNMAGAKAAFEHALSLDPHDPLAHHELARLNLRRSGGLAAAARGFATTVGADPGNPSASVGRRNLDLVVRIFLNRASYLLFVASYFAAGGFGQSGSLTSRLIPLGLLLVPAAFVAWFVWRLTPELRRFLLRSLSAPPPRLAAVICEAAAAGCIVAASLVPHHLRPAIGGTAFVLALVGRICLMYAKTRS